MSHRVHKRARRAARAAAVTATSLPVILMCASAGAQQTPQQGSQSQTNAGTGDIQEVVVTGYRESLQSALDAKRKAIQPIDSVAAEDIGKMPDQNVSEVLQRLPGISINRAGGKGTQVLIDGLGNNLITLNGEVLLTGREIYVAGESSGGGGNSGLQYASLEGIPTEEIGGVDVIKNPTARDREGGLGGQVDLKTRSPLAQSMGMNLSAYARGTTSTGEGGATPVGVLVGGYKFNDSFAITAGASYDDEKTHDKAFQDQNRSQWLITNTATVGSYVGSPVASTNTTLPNGQTYIEPQLAYFSDVLQQIKTKGATLGAEWTWTDDIRSTFNYFYVREEETDFTYSNKAWFSGGSGETNKPGAPASYPGIDPSQPYSIDPNGVIQSATMMANGAETASLFEENRTTAHNFQLNTKFLGDGPVKGDAGFAYAKATGDYQAAQADVEHGFYHGFGQSSPSIQLAAPGCDNGANNCPNGNHGYAWIWNNGGNSGLPSAQYPNNYGYTDVLSNPAYTLFKSNWAWKNTVDEKQWAFKVNATGRAGPVDISAGARYQDREVDFMHGKYLISGVSPYGIGGIGAATPVTGNCCIGPGSGTWLYYQDPGYANIPYSTPQSNPNLYMYYNNFAVGKIGVKNPYAGGMTNPATYLSTLWAQAGVPNMTETFFKDPLNTFVVKEKSTAGYLMGDLDGSNYHANVGVRVVKTQLTVDGAGTNPAGSTYVGTASWNGVNANDVAFETKRTYTDVLPSLNFVFDATDTQKIRFGAAKVVAPQNLQDLGAGLYYGFTRAAPQECPGGGVCFKFDGGHAGNAKLDPFRATQLNLSWEDYFAPGGIVSIGGFYKKVKNFVTTANVSTVVPDGTTAGGTAANLATLVNGGSGSIKGLELGAQYAFNNGFGVQANYTRSDSDSTQTDSFSSHLPIPGVSKNSVNVIGYYEHAGFSGRLAYAWRDTAINSGGVGSSFNFQDINGNGKTYTVYRAPYGQLDGQLSYDFGPHFGVIASVVNLTNEKQHTYLQWKNEPFTYDDTGRRFFFGVKGKL